MSRILGWVTVVFLVWWIVSDPHGAAGVGHNLMGMAGHLGSSLGAFIGALTSGGAS